MAIQCSINCVIRRGLLSSPLKRTEVIPIIACRKMALVKNVESIPTLGVESQQNAKKCVEHFTVHELHVSSQKTYPTTKALPLPDNIEEIDDSELACFSPQRDRDISGSVILSKTVTGSADYNQHVVSGDPHMGSYDCHSALSLNSAMQTNVPEPFSSDGKSTHLNMPGGQWGQGQKYISEDMQNSHYSKVSCNSSGKFLQGTSELNGQAQFLRRHFSFPTNCTFDRPCALTYGRTYCTSNNTGKLSRKDQLKRAVKEYGSTVIVFHVGISLLSLGGCYLAVTSGMNVTGALNSLGPGSEVAAEAGQFVVAYAVHKMFAPVRIGITLASTPFIVRYLRKVGFLKAPRPQT